MITHALIIVSALLAWGACAGVLAALWESDS